MQVNSAPGGGRKHAARTGQNRKQMSERHGIARSEGRNEWTRAGGSDGGRQVFFFVGRLGPPCASLSEKPRYPSGLPLSVAWQQVYRGSFFKNQASPTAGIAPDKKDPLWRGFLGSQTSAGKRLWRTNERFCGRGRAGHGGQVDGQRKREREREGTKQGAVEEKEGKDALTYMLTISGSQTRAQEGVLRGLIRHLFNASYRHLCHVSRRVPLPSAVLTLGAVMWLRAAATHLVFDGGGEKKTNKKRTCDLLINEEERAITRKLYSDGGGTLTAVVQNDSVLQCFSFDLCFG